MFLHIRKSVDSSSFHLNYRKVIPQARQPQLNPFQNSGREMEWQQVVITDNNLMKRGDCRSSESHLLGKRLQAAPFVVFFSHAVTKMHTIHNMEVKRKIIGHE